MENIIIIAIGMFFTGFVDAIAGGGGIISVPLLMWSGLPVKAAIATNKVGGIVGNSTTAYNYYKKKKINKKIVFICAPVALIGAFIGSQLLRFIPSDKLEEAVPYVLIVLVLYIFFSKKLGIEEHFKGYSIKNNTLMIIATFAVGVYNGFFGPASGSFLTVSLLSIYGMSFLEGTATSKPINLFMTAASIIAFVISGTINLKIGIVCAIFRAVGAKLGSSYAMKLSQVTIKYLFITVTTLVIIKMLVFS